MLDDDEEGDGEGFGEGGAKGQQACGRGRSLEN